MIPSGVGGSFISKLLSDIPAAANEASSKGRASRRSALVAASVNDRKYVERQGLAPLESDRLAARSPHSPTGSGGTTPT